jgi:transposase InsO family protein
MHINQVHNVNGIFQHVLYVPELNGNLLSVQQLALDGHTAEFRQSECIIRNMASNRVVSKASLDQGLYILGVSVLKMETANVTCASSDSKASLNQWHCWLGHINVNYVRRMVKKGMVNGMSMIPDSNEKTDTICAVCLHGKQTRKPIPSETETHASEILKWVYSDVCGAMSTQSHEGHWYYMMVTDDYSWYSWVFFLKHKSEVPLRFKEWIALAKNETGKCVKKFCNDGGGEYLSSDFLGFLKEKGILWENTNANTPQENGISEWLNQTLNNAATSMLEDTEPWLRKSFWTYTVKHAALIKNWVPTQALPSNLTPHEAYYGRKPSVML